MYLAKIIITLRSSILDPQGKAVHHALQNLGMASTTEVRMGKYIEMKVSGGTKEEARRVTEEACKKLLANPVMEDYTYTLESM
ncbi:MAG: phosphoribosylformylglycinamidine synthase subunit PurS [Bacteroidota bacterium]